MTGWICSYRKVWENPIFEGNAARVGVWDWMLKQAAWKDVRFATGNTFITVKRGQLCVSQAQLEKATGMSRQALRTFLNLLEKDGSIVTQSATGSTKGRKLITICNYDDYQAFNQESNQTPTKRQPNANQLKNKGTREQDNSDYVGAQAPAKAGPESAPDTPPDPAKIMFDSGVKLLVAAGDSEKAARNFIAGKRKDHGTGAVIEAIGRATRECASEPKSFIVRCLKFSGKPRRERLAPGQSMKTDDGWTHIEGSPYEFSPDGEVREPEWKRRQDEAEMWAAIGGRC